MCAGVAFGSLLVFAPSATAASAPNRRDVQTTDLISARPDGGIPNGPSTHAVISGDRRFARAIAFESQASDLVAGDVNGYEDVFATFRRGHFDNTGGRWERGPTRQISSTRTGAPSNGPSAASTAPRAASPFYLPRRTWFQVTPTARWTRSCLVDMEARHSACCFPAAAKPRRT
jgi:hypothetical protein